jgi:hypothetical protein
MFVVNNKQVKEANVVFYSSLAFLSVATAVFAYVCGA